MADPRVPETFTRLVDIMARLRRPGGCPWDREQTHETLRPYLIEEAYEVFEAIDRGELSAIRDELGDLLLQVVFHAELAAEAGRFTIADVAQAIADKLVRRHPHVFADVEVRDAQEVVRNWTRIKAEERRERGDDGADPFAGVPTSLPALLRGQLGEHQAAVGGPCLHVPGARQETVDGSVERHLGRDLEVAAEAGEGEQQIAQLVRDGSAIPVGDRRF